MRVIKLPRIKMPNPQLIPLPESHAEDSTFIPNAMVNADLSLCLNCHPERRSAVRLSNRAPQSKVPYSQNDSRAPREESPEAEEENSVSANPPLSRRAARDYRRKNNSQEGKGLNIADKQKRAEESFPGAPRELPTAA
jgi:hypothetical protein